GPGAGIQYGLQGCGEGGPIRDRIRHRLVENEQPDDLRAHEPQTTADLFAAVTLREMPPAVDFIEPVAQFHAPPAGATTGNRRQRLIPRPITHSSINPIN